MNSMTGTWRRGATRFALCCSAYVAHGAALAGEINESPGGQFELQGEALGDAPIVETNHASKVSPADIAQDMAGLRTLSSFPARLKVGDRPEAEWPQATRRYQPKAASLDFKAGRCVFSIQTGEFTLRSFSLGAGGKLTVTDDALEHSSTTQADAGAFFNLDAELYVDVKAAKLVACKGVFSGKRMLFGSVSLGDTRLRAVSRAGVEAASDQLGSIEGIDVYLVWDEQYGRLMLEDSLGLVPSVKSAITKLTPGAPDYYYLSATVELRLVRAPSAMPLDVKTLRRHHAS